MPACEASIGTLLKEAGLDAHEARHLLARASGMAEAIIAAFPERMIASAATGLFRDWARQRRYGQPLAYILGHREFYGRDFAVSPAVLIPRPDTELLVDCALERITADERVLDLGTGSGAIAVTLACERPRARVTAVDRSVAALDVARRNAEALASGRVTFIESDWYDAIDDTGFDLIVSNPPYIAADDPHLGRGDLRFEPRGALVGGSLGSECIEAIAAGARHKLRPGGTLLLEHGYDQGAATRRILDQAGFADVCTWRDLAGHERVTGCTNPGVPQCVFK